MRTTPPNRRGITLVEVLVSIFVLGIGLLSVLSLFTAGRDLEARAVRQTAARGYAGVIEPKILDVWSRLENWRWTDGPSWHAYDPLDQPATDGMVKFPVLIDPVGLNGTSVVLPARTWDWNRFVLAPAAEPQMAFRRMSVFSGTAAPSQAAFLNALADADAVEFRVPQETRDGPPLNVFEYGRRARRTEFTPALFVAQYPFTTPTQSHPVSPGTEVIRWLLVFRNLAPGSVDESKASPNDQTQAWPTGFLAFDVLDAQAELLSIQFPPGGPRRDDASLRRSLKPGRWMLIARKPPGADPPLAWMIHWATIVSATREEANENANPEEAENAGWWLTIDPPLPNDDFLKDPATPPALIPPYRVFSFESLIHVKQIDLTPYTLQ